MKKYQVFISSTYEDLKEERAAVTQCLLEADCFPMGMEQFPASNMTPMDYIRKMLNDCDYYILILAGRYGSCDSDGIGFTEKEFDYAISQKIPVMCFLIEDVGNLPNSKCEGTDVGKRALEAFRKKVSKKLLVKYYTDIGSLKAEVAHSLAKCIRDCPRPGWIRANEGVSNVVSQVSATQLIYANAAFSGKFTFDYSDNNGRYTIGTGDHAFVTRWSKASDVSIYAYRDDVEAIARIKGPTELQHELKGEFNFTSRTRNPNIGDIIIWKNQHGKYAATKIIDIKDDTRGATHDELTCEYVIYQ